jgi:predicted glycoside hydrolase/deacetylase ChbG (UPF0249 family)
VPEPAPLVERLGLGADARALIITCDDLGTTHAANTGSYDALRDGLATSASLTVPGPWAREAAARYRGEDVGVALTLNAEWDLLRWGPTTRAPSLLDGDGGFPRTMQEVWENADLDEVRRECRTQIERAVLWGFDVTHIGSHLHVMPMRPEFFDVYVDLALEFSLPVRLPDSSMEPAIGFPVRKLATEEGLVFPDHVVQVVGAVRSTLERLLFELPIGVTEVRARPAVDADEIRAAAPDWAHRVDDHDALVHDRGLRTLADRAGVTLVGYRALRRLLRRT